MLLGMRSGKRGTPPTPAAPVNTVAPAITGSPVVGQTLTASQGSWTGYPTPTFAYQWKSGATNVGTNSNTYVPVTGDIGNAITVVVTATNSQAPGGVQATSAATAAVTASSGTAGILDFSDLNNSAHVATIGA